ncbi:GntR family transcriptional regulator [Kineosporia sp. NBRC 101731]|uniref:GntR family transcriptional regulator n=1 Tax=Kineosporia sp. NBRC 101731 TaxID=3032199 RepID=UPI0024A40F28|nr:GntR family transcriptional regulator [Kineosporia sp. NBRC 101731]GLY33927.1 GntR family transcriptional regulator [Kineosporia sp. NBRC 101731]
MASARDTIYATLRSRLTSGHYPEDASLIPQVLSEEFQVSRTPVREALGLLERDGLLVSTQRGFALRRRSDEEMLEIFEARAILESSAAYAAALRRSPIDLARLDDLLARTRTETEPAAIRSCFNLWHEAVRQAAHNQTIGALLHTLDAQAKLSAPWKTPLAEGTFDASIAEHEQMTEAIRSQDGERARTLMLEHQAHDRDTRILQLVSEMAQTSPTSPAN